MCLAKYRLVDSLLHIIVSQDLLYQSYLLVYCYGFGMGQTINLKKICLIKMTLTKGAYNLENTAQIVFGLAMLCLGLSVITLIISLIKYGMQEGFSLKKRLVKISFSLLGGYAVLTAVLIYLIN